ncbi:hypothetical protein [Streptomyces vinaceus]|uniref:hypothetical protein n=1 Tax=Streptomyces vinaceus TaxID=1960 RepID=UPI003808308B
MASLLNHHDGAVGGHAQPAGAQRVDGAVADRQHGLRPGDGVNPDDGPRAFGKEVGHEDAAVALHRNSAWCDEVALGRHHSLSRLSAGPGQSQQRSCAWILSILGHQDTAIGFSDPGDSHEIATQGKEALKACDRIDHVYCTLASEGLGIGEQDGTGGDLVLGCHDSSLKREQGITPHSTAGPTTTGRAGPAPRRRVDGDPPDRSIRSPVEAGLEGVGLTWA